jgi:hypothetical protein
MPFERLDEFTKKVVDLTDTPSENMSPADIKSWFDSSPEELRIKFNKLVEELNANKANWTINTGDHKGSWHGVTPEMIGASDINGARLTVAENKISNTDSKIGNLEELETVENSNLVKSVNEINTVLSEKISQEEFYDISINQINKNKGKLDQTYMTEEFLQQIAGNTPINTTPANDSITTEKLANKSVREKKLDKVVLGLNMFDASKRTTGNYVQYTNGVLQPNATYDATEFIEVEPSTTYIRNFSHQLAFYDANKVYISGINTSASVTDVTTFTTPSNAKYIRMGVGNYFINQCMIAKGSSLPTYEPYKYVMKDLRLDSTVFQEQIDSSQISIIKSKESKRSNNLVDPQKYNIDVYANATSGVLSSSASYNATDYIEIKPSTVYSRSYSHQMAFYDSAKVFISGIAALSPANQSSSFTTPSTAKYMRLTTDKANSNSFMVNEGSQLLPYESYGFKLDNLLSNDELLLFLPSEICIAVGRTIEIYNKQVAWSGNIENYHFKWECPIGSALKRKWSCEGKTANIGNHTLTCTVYDNNMKQIAKVSTTVKVVDTALTAPKKLLCIGDSLTNDKAWMPELDTLANSMIQFVGSRQWVYYERTFYHEGRSGFSAASYLAATQYTYEGEGVHPFWNPSTSQFDYAYYKTQTGVNPDAIQIFLGTNGISLDPTTNADNIKTIVDRIRSADSVIPIYVVFTLYRGDQNGIGKQLSTDGYSAGSGVWKLEEDRKVYNLMVKLNELLSGYSNLHFIPIALTHDSEFNFGSTQVPVNPRAFQTESQAIEATHPQEQGYFQMADIIYSTWCAYND